MPLICYVEKKFKPESLRMIAHANKIIGEYSAKGYTLTLRQIYYQFVARDLLGNTQRNYKNLGSVINDARLAGEIDWNAIEDRTRSLESLSHWENPETLVEACAEQFRIDKWKDQPYRVEVWIEKEALAGVFERVCRELDVPYLSCRGYTSQSEMWRAAMRLKAFEREKQKTLILHFGDHDPSGIDMTRDIEDRLCTFGSRVEIKRIALNMDQIEEHGFPPNPCKLTDARANGYVERFGDESWELDAMEPDILAGLVREEIEAVRDADIWEETVSEEKRAGEALQNVSERWDEVVDYLGSET